MIPAFTLLLVFMASSFRFDELQMTDQSVVTAEREPAKRGSV